MCPATSQFEIAPHGELPCRHEDVVGLALSALNEHDLDVFLRRAVRLVADALDVESVELLEHPPDRMAPFVRAGIGLEATVDGWTSAMSAVVSGDAAGPYGLLAVSTAHARAFTPDEVRCVQVVADLLAGAIRRVQAEETLKRAEANYRALVERLPVVTYVDALDETSSSIYASPQIEPLTGYSANDWAEDPELFVKMLHPDDRGRVLNEHARVRGTGEALMTEYRLIRRDGRVVWIEDHAAVVQEDRTRGSYLQGVMLDVTEQKRLEEELQQSQKMEAVGQLAGGIAHDFNNLLTGIIGYAELVLQNLGPEDPVRADVNEIAVAGHRAANLTKQLLAFSRKQVLELRVISLNDVVSEVGRMLRRVLGEDIRVVDHLDAALGRVRADSGQLGQVLMNLAVNARDAMPDGGTLVIETANVELGDEYAHRNLDRAEPGRYVVLAVSDSGHGMDTETLERVFDPFFTTKGPGEGTGLGLSTVYGLVKQSGGFVWAYSERGIGTVFRIYLPRVDDPVASAEAVISDRPLQGGQETIMLVEEEEFVRNLIARDLRRLGYTVVVAADPDQAIEFASDRERLDLVVTDVAMRGRDGFELANELTRLRDGLKVLYMTGYASAAIDRGGTPDTVIEKPFGPEKLAMRVRKLLDRKLGS